MSGFFFWLRDRRVWLLALCIGLALVFGLAAFGPKAAVEGVSRTGYWALLVVFVLFLRALWSVWRQVRVEWRPGRRELQVLGLVALGGTVLLAHERYGFKILADEMLLVGTSMGIHHERKVTYPVRASNVQGPFQLLDRVLDKRPFFYPFLVSLAHDFTGYRPSNAFYVNTALGFLFLILVYLLGWRIAGTRWAGLLAILLFVGLPLYAQQMKGAGFDLLNLVMLAGTTLLAMRYAVRRDAVTLEALALSAVLLAFTRYESVVFLVPVALLVAWSWWREQRVILTWPVVFSPLVMTLYLLQHRVFTLKETAWELASRPEATSPFGLQYLSGNLAHALAFFFDTSGFQPNSPVFAAIGLCALPFFVLWLGQALVRAPRTQPWKLGVVTAGVGLGVIASLLMVYFWGQFDHPVIHRLSLPVHLLMVVAIAAVGGQLIQHRRGWQALCAVALVGLIMYSLPVMSRRAYAHSYSPAVEMEWRQEFIERYPDLDYLFIDNDAVFWIAHEIPATPIQQAQLRKDGLIFHLQNRTFSAMYVFQRFKVDPANGQRRIDPADDLGPDFELELVWERSIQALLIGRISRVTAIRDEAGARVDRTSTFLVAPAAPKTEAELEEAKEEFVKKWVKQLP